MKGSSPIFHRIVRYLSFGGLLTAIPRVFTASLPSNGGQVLALSEFLPINNTSNSSASIAFARPANKSVTLPEYACLEELGTNIDASSCRNAISKIPQSRRRISFGWRGAGGTFDVILPYIWMSGKSRLSCAFSYGCGCIFHAWVFKTNWGVIPWMFSNVDGQMTQNVRSSSWPIGQVTVTSIAIKGYRKTQSSSGRVALPMLPSGREDMLTLSVRNTVRSPAGCTVDV